MCFTNLHHFSSNNQKILTKDIINWLELITEILSFLQIFNVTKTTTQLFQYSWKSSATKKKKKKINKKIYIYILDTFWMFKGKLETIHVTTYISLFLPYSNTPYSSTIYPCLSLLFSHFVFVFSSSFSCSSRCETQSTNCNV